MCEKIYVICIRVEKTMLTVFMWKDLNAIAMGEMMLCTTTGWSSAYLLVKNEAVLWSDY